MRQLKNFQISCAVNSALTRFTVALIAGQTFALNEASDFLAPSTTFFHSAGTFFSALIAVRISAAQLRVSTRPVAGEVVELGPLVREDAIPWVSFGAAVLDRAGAAPASDVDV
ncbi:hypothetical protein [Curtobacterium sp. UNCCL20]|uniref:hypothetical protein n=1 Tax=Curtobacterium sp. UNCCL20 TaxID=1502773 RepID=UPI000B89DD62|nr:hypothetical protein [Curtobacterium sp. UNCCL20]